MRKIGLVLVCLFVSTVTGQAQKNQALEQEKFAFEKTQAQAAMQLERDKLALERERFAFSQEQARVSQEQSNRTNWTAWSVLLSALIGSGTLAFSFYNLRKQAELQTVLQREQAALQFQIKAVEVTLTGARSSTVAYQRALWLKAVFGDLLPKTFGQEFKDDNKDYAFGNSVERKLELMKLIAEKAPDVNVIVDAWRKLNPKDEWFELF